MVSRAVALLLIPISVAAFGQASLEVIALRYRTADQVLDALRPLVEPGGTLTGQGNQLIVRVSPGNLAEIRQALDAIDRPQRRLQISVRFDDALESTRRDLAVGGVVSNQGVRIEGSARDSQRNVDERVDRRVHALDGARSTILTGESRPVRQRQYIQTPTGVVSREVVVVEETSSGFEVVPRVSGNMVTMEIHASRAGSATVSSTASGRLGEWFELGAIAGTAARDERGIGAMSQSAATQSRRVWVRVDPLD